MPPFFSNGPAKKRRAGPSCDEPPTNLKVMVAKWGLDNGERAPPGGSAEAGAAATPTSRAVQNALEAVLAERLNTVIKSRRMNVLMKSGN